MFPNMVFSGRFIVFLKYVCNQKKSIFVSNAVVHDLGFFFD